MVNDAINIIYRITCRICKSKNLVSILDLGNLYVSDFVDSESSGGFKIPLELVMCKDCSLLQLRHTTPAEVMYRQYWYKSGVNQTMRNALADITDKVENLIKLSPGDFVLDIGSNDSTLLRTYRTQNLLLVGFEPATNLIEEARIGTTKIINDFFNYEAFEREFGETKAKAITAIAMFYDLEDPNKFVGDIVKCLDKDGVFVIQMNYLPLMLENNAFDNISHEHLEYYSLTSLKNLLQRHNLKIFDVELNDLNGGSFRIYIKHNVSSLVPFEGAEKRVRDMEEFENKLGLTDVTIYREFANKVSNLKSQLYSFIKEETEKGKKVHAYGASSRGNTLLQFCNLDNALIKAAAERNPVKYGKKTIGTWIPIISEAQARNEKPDYFLVLPWAFIKEFVERESEYLNSGGKFIVPAPKFEIISK